MFPLIAVGGCNGIADGPWFALPCDYFQICLNKCGFHVNLQSMLVTQNNVVAIQHYSLSRFLEKLML